MFAKNLTTHVDSDFYLLTGNFLSEFLKLEKIQQIIQYSNKKIDTETNVDRKIVLSFN